MAIKHVNNEHWDNTLNANAVRILYALQQGRCCITGVQFALPVEPLLPRTTLTSIATGRFPLLVRAIPQDSWRIGNVILILTALNDLNLLADKHPDKIIRYIGCSGQTIMVPQLNDFTNYKTNKET